MPLTPAITGGFATIVGTGSVLTKPEDIIPYSFDGTAALRQMPSGCFGQSPSPVPLTEPADGLAALATYVTPTDVTYRYPG